VPLIDQPQAVGEGLSTQEATTRKKKGGEMYDVRTGMATMRRCWRSGTAAVAAVFLLTAPAALAAGTATTNHPLADSKVKSAIEDEFLTDATVPFHAVDVKVLDGVVTLSGTVDTLLARDRAVDLARSIRGVRSVVNELQVKPVPRSDADLHRDIEEALATDPAADSYEVKVSVADGVATLTGTVDSWQEKRIVGRVVEGVRGVKRVDNDLTFRIPATRPDAEIQAEIRDRLHWDARVDDGLVNVVVNDGEVRLSGAVGSALERAYARGDAWVPGVKRVDDSDLKVEWWARDEMRRDKYVFKSDDQIRRAVEDTFLYDPRVLSFKPRVEVDNGTVTLSGVVDNAEARRAAERDARNTVGVLMVRNHLQVRPANAVGDATITRKVEQALSRDPMLDRYGVVVTTYDGEVTLTGEVDSRFEKRLAEDDASTVAGVVDVHNRLDVQPAIARSDRDIEQNVENQLIWSPFVDASDVHVAVDGGVATLTGTVDTWMEYSQAARSAREGGAVSVRNELKVKPEKGAAAVPSS
jgi:osmotically-inducible protein OsmY